MFFSCFLCLSLADRAFVFSESRAFFEKVLLTSTRFLIEANIFVAQQILVSKLTVKHEKIKLHVRKATQNEIVPFFWQSLRQKIK